MTKVLMINTVSTKRDGITNVICNLSTAIDKENLKVDLLTINDPAKEYIQLFEEQGGRVYTIQGRLKKPWVYVFRLVQLIRRNGYDVVHAHGNSNTLALEMFAAKLAGCHVRIAHSHNTTCSFMFAHKILKPVFSMCCNGRMACGTAAGEWLFGKKSFTVINNGIQTEKFRYNSERRATIRNSLNIQENEKLLGHVGSFNSLKNQEFILDILSALLSKKDAEYKLLLVGDGELRREAETKVVELGIRDKVIFAGLQDDIPGYLSAMDVFVMPSLKEGFPLTLVEAQASGLSCVVSDAITGEVNLTGNVSFISLDQPAKVWADRIGTLDYRADRKERSEQATLQINEQDFSIEKEAGILKEYYFHFLNEYGK